MLSCPRCPDGKLETETGKLTCSGCQTQYPLIGSMPCLMGDPTLWRSLWVSRLAEFISYTDGTVANQRAEMSEGDLLPRTCARVARVMAGFEDRRVRVDALFDDLKAGISQTIPTRPEAGTVPAVLACYENIFRDWAWGDREIAVSRSLVEQIAPEPLGRLAVFGAGAGRLAVEVHETMGPAETVALDMNPLPLLVAEKLVHGETVELPEFPVAPHSDDQVVISRRMSHSPPLRAGFTFVFADALSAPFAPGSLDTVLTPWFIDVVDADVRQTTAAINRVLRPGGIWINLGPLRFKNTVGRSYCIEEIWDMVAQGAFELLSRKREDVPYFDSPANGSRRIETVFCFAARKTGEAGPLVTPAPPRPWIDNTSLPIPMTPTLMGLGRTSWFTAGAIALIDGHRSMADVADELARTLGLDPMALLNQLRAFFAKLPPE